MKIQPKLLYFNNNIYFDITFGAVTALNHFHCINEASKAWAMPFLCGK